MAREYKKLVNKRLAMLPKEVEIKQAVIAKVKTSELKPLADGSIKSVTTA